jgi:transcriptional regulator with XRE-family HTH domain
MSKKKIADMTMAERAELAKQVERLRREQNMNQADLAALAGTDRGTIINIEGGKRVPQARVLTRIFDALGQEDGELEFLPETQAWLSSMGTLIEMIPEQTRPKHVNIAIKDLAAGIGDTGDVDKSNVVQFPTVGGELDYEDGSHQAVASRDDEGGVEEDDDRQE